MSDIKQLISIIIPVYNESESIGFLLDEVINVMSFHKFNFELIVVNDGSKDNTQQVLKQQTLKIKELSVISLRKNYGQTSAMSAGFDNSKGDIVITLDGDLQNDPNDVPILISEINKGISFGSFCKSPSKVITISPLESVSYTHLTLPTKRIV